MREWRVEKLTVRAYDDVDALAADAADDAAGQIREAIAARGHANLMLATGTSQLVFLARLIAIAGPDSDAPIDWSRVTGFHMDEYVGLPPTHPASFQRYMRERVAAHLPFGAFHYVDGDASDPDEEAARYAQLLIDHPIDVCCLGIGENGHLAFNDPPVADFDDPLVVKVVELDARCKQQQVGEGHFATPADVPPRAITVTVPGLLRARHALAIVPEARKAAPVKAALEGPYGTACPATFLRTQPQTVLYLDAESASQLT
ncbi:MAG TPA: glucosamine-6-phosphate deaminase [Acidimicrobiia bacterium]|nr:glucosamine-6-phosphate deaminase [Acidimicrobiia bacterium]